MATYPDPKRPDPRDWRAAYQKVNTARKTIQAHDKQDLTSFRSRQIAGITDVEMLHKLRGAGMPALMYGPPGSGKSRLAREAFPGMLTINGDGDTVTDDFVGSWYSTGDARQFEWGDGPLVTAMKEGRVLFIDDITVIPPKVLAIIYPVMDGRGWVQVKGHLVPDGNGGHKHEMVEAAPGFYIVAACNPGTHGAYLSDALASRFAFHLHVETDLSVARDMGIDSRVVKLAANLATQRASGDIGWSPQIRELVDFERLSRLGDWKLALANLITACPEEDRTVVIDAATPVFGEKLAVNKLGAIATA